MSGDKPAALLTSRRATPTRSCAASVRRVRSNSAALTDFPRVHASRRESAISLVGTLNTRSPRAIRKRSNEPAACRQSSGAQTRSGSSSRAHTSSAPKPRRLTDAVFSPPSSPVLAATKAAVCERLWVSGPSTIIDLVPLHSDECTPGRHGLLEALRRSRRVTRDIPGRRRATRRKSGRSGRQPQNKSARRPAATISTALNIPDAPIKQQASRQQRDCGESGSSER